MGAFSLSLDIFSCCFIHGRSSVHQLTSPRQLPRLATFYLRKFLQMNTHTEADGEHCSDVPLDELFNL